MSVTSSISSTFTSNVSVDEDSKKPVVCTNNNDVIVELEKERAVSVKFATHETLAGFPMPALPKQTDSRRWPPDNQEDDVDICVQNIISQKDWITKVYDKDAIKDWSAKSWSYHEKKNDGVLRYAVDECRWRHKQWIYRVGTPATISKTGLVLSKDNICQDLRSSIMEDLQNLRQQEVENSMSTVALHPKYKNIHQLVHPSLYAYEKGVTHILPGAGATATSSPSWDSFLGIDCTVNHDKPVKPETEGLRTDGFFGNTYHRDSDSDSDSNSNSDSDSDSDRDRDRDRDSDSDSDSESDSESESNNNSDNDSDNENGSDNDSANDNDNDNDSDNDNDNDNGSDNGRNSSSNFQWLPSEFIVSSSPKDGDVKTTTKPKCHINSYINNLHPIEYQGLYDKIGELFVETLPLLEEVLSEMNGNGKVRKQLPRFDSKVRERSSWRPYMRGPEPKEEKIVEPPIPKFSPPKYATEKKDVNLKDRPLQVIVKLISMELQPDKEDEEKYDSMTFEQQEEHHNNPPHYFREGHWHVEGTYNERIVASACCYLDSENVWEEGLHFRDGSVNSLGCELGKVETCPGRILVWPNYLHHKTGSVELVDNDRPGHRTLCCFHLVDPTLRIRSTATVPPQQQTWLNELTDVALTSFQPDDLVRSIIQMSMVKDGSTINYEEALERRHRLSKERSGDCNIISENFWIPED